MVRNKDTLEEILTPIHLQAGVVQVKVTEVVHPKEVQGLKDQVDQMKWVLLEEED